MNSRTLVVLLAATLLATSAAVAGDKPASKPASPKPTVVLTPGGSVVSVSGTTTLSAGAEIVMCDVSGGSYTITLPPASSLGQRITIMITSYSASPFSASINFAGQGSDVIIDGFSGPVGVTSSALYMLGSSVEFISNGQGVWFAATSMNYGGLGAHPPVDKGNPSSK